MISPAAAEEIPNGLPVAKIRAVSPVSVRFQSETVAASKTIPIPVWERLSRSGWRVQLAEFVVDADPSLKGERPRGWPSGWSWDHTDGVNVPKKRLLVFAEKRRTLKGAVVRCSRVAGVLRHEVGHAFDMSAGGKLRYISSRSNFQSAYIRDTRHMSAQIRKTLAYYLQHKSAGRQETFAEAFAIILGGGSDPTHHEQFTQSFPAVIQFVESLIRNVEPVGNVAVRRAQ